MGLNIPKSQACGVLKNPSPAQQGYVPVKMVHVVLVEVAMAGRSAMSISN
jgi:hypothetical protein